MTWKCFEDIDAWQMARVLSREIHLMIQSTAIRKNFALRDQLYRSAGSVMDNIAEGFERGGNKEFRTFLGYAKGSCGEVRSQLYRCLDMELITSEQYEKLNQSSLFIAGKIYRLIEYLNRSGIKGSRFK